ncbi:MAG: L-lactate permease [Ardenticatenales bacterium]|nr:L-lactate permease [Ardenticatenales bacterium]
MTTTLWLSLAALLPIFVVLFALIRLRWSGARAGTAGWAIALLLALALFQVSPELLLYAHLRSLLLSLYVLYIIWMALLLYHVVNEAEAIQDISAGVARLTGDRLIQLLILAWIFASFIQGVTGFGVPVAVVTPLLIGMGFDPVQTVVAAGVAHCWAVTFGSGGSAFYTLVAVTDVPGETLALPSAMLLGAMALLCGAAAAHLGGGWRGVLRSAPFVLLVGLTMAGTQYFLAAAGFWTIASFGAGGAGLLAAIPLARLPAYRGEPAPRVPGAPRLRERLPVAMSAYFLLLLIVLAADLIPSLTLLLNRIEITYTFPEVRTGLGWVVPAGPGRAVSLFGHAGALIAYAALLSMLVYRAAGRYTPGTEQRIFRKTLAGSIASTLGILMLVAMALIMDNSGMVFAIADGLQRVIPRSLYPLAAPLIGALGSFMTGSNTNSNVIFAPLQQQVAALSGMSVPAILAAQTTGGALGSMIAPAKILVGASTANVAGREGEVLRTTWPYALVLLLATGLLTYGLL